MAVDAAVLFTKCTPPPLTPYPTTGCLSWPGGGAGCVWGGGIDCLHLLTAIGKCVEVESTSQAQMALVSNLTGLAG